MKHEIYGNTAGIRDALLNRMKTIYDMGMSSDVFCSSELVALLAEMTGIIEREILVYISRAGEVKYVRIGDDRTVGMEEMRLVRNLDRLAGVRCIHTHPESSGMLSEVDMGSLNTLRLDAMAAIGVRNGIATDFYAGYIGEMIDDRHETVLFGPLRADRLPQKALMEQIYIADRALMSSTYDVTERRPDRAVLCGIEGREGYDTLSELAELCETDGLVVVGRELQRNRTADPATYIGGGKAEELHLACNALEADVCVFDDELSAIQMRNLEEVLGLPIIDRTMLILDIFAQRAESREGKLQVELAQLQYRLPRLIGMGRVLSRQGAGVGMRGPGEKKLEIDRRRIRRRIYELEQSLEEIDKQRSLRREKRNANPVPVVALVGYTNAGKSTLLNALSGSDALAEDKLFATLDPLVRRVTLPNGTKCLVSDTVGFINKLPHDLVNAFRSTLEEVRDADLVLHVVDSSSPYHDVQMRVVEDVLGSLNALDTPRLDVFNKADLSHAAGSGRDNTVSISAETGEGLDVLKSRIESMLNRGQVRLSVTVPYDRYDAIRIIRETGTLLSESHEADGTHIEALIDENELWRVKNALDG